MATWKEHNEEFINEYFEMIKKKIVGGQVFMIPVDPQNIKHVVVAAYGLGQSEALKSAAAQINELLELI